jgi:hypothetical protein
MVAPYVVYVLRAAALGAARSSYCSRLARMHQSSFTPLALIGIAHFSISFSTKLCR